MPWQYFNSEGGGWGCFWVIDWLIYEIYCQVMKEMMGVRIMKVKITALIISNLKTILQIKFQSTSIKSILIDLWHF